MRVLQNTLLKTSTAQAESISDESQKTALRVGEILTVESWREADAGHLKLFFTLPCKNRQEWFAFGNHIELLKSDGTVLEVTDLDADTAPNSDRTQAPEPGIILPPPNQRPVRMVSILGKQVNLYAPIIEGGNFIWAEALHDGERLPQCAEHRDAIIRMARELQKARQQIDKPFKITSWYRPEPWNRRAGGAKKSQHLGGGGTDILVKGSTGKQLAAALSWWKGGIGIYPHMPHLLHLDVRGYRARWGF